MESEEREVPVVLEHDGQRLFGILHHGDPAATCGLLILVGGPQYRIGSHRQFVLLARDAARHGVPVLRFDFQGMGDSEGEPVSYLAVGPQIRTAVDRLHAVLPGLDGVVLWGLCDAAVAAALYAPTDPRVSGLVLLNPWLRSERSLARTYVFDYYLRRLLRPSGWRRFREPDFSPRAAAASFLRLATRAFRPADRAPAGNPEAGGGGGEDPGTPVSRRVVDALSAFPGPVTILLSGNDLTAAEFGRAVGEEPGWRALKKGERLRSRSLEAADHTFSRAAWRDWVVSRTLEHLRR